MKKEFIAELFEKFENARLNIENLECWSARELQVIYDYKEWRNFHKVIEKAKTACENSNFPLSDHFVEFNKLVEIGSGTQREIIDLALTRYACYLIAQNGDPSKKEIAFAQTYFAVQTRKQEIVETRLLDIARVSAREKLTRSEKKLSSIIYERGIDDKGFAIIRSRGDKALFGGFSTAEMKQKLAVPNKNPLADYLPTLTIKAKDFATELTSHNVEEKNLKGMESISTEHIDNNKSVRKILLERGVVPENLPPAEDVKKIKRRLNSEENKALNPESKKISKPPKPKNDK